MARLHPRDLEGMFAGLPGVLRGAVPIGMGFIAALGHEGWMPGVLVFGVAMVLTLLLFPTSARSSGWFGWLFGLGYFATTLRWIIEPFLVDPVRHGWMAPFAIILLAGGLALFWAAAFWAARVIAGRGRAAMLWLPVTLAMAELTRGHVFTGFPWGLPAYTLIGRFGDVWFAWVGPYGTTLLFLCVAGVTAYCLVRGWIWVWPALAGVLFATLGLNIFTPAPPPATENIVRLVQPNAPQHQKWDRDWMTVFFDRAIDFTAASDAADVVIWPETSIPTVLEYADPWIEQMSIAARGAAVVAGIQRREGEAYYNSAVVIDAPDSIAEITDKSHLVPFGEYIPLAWLLEPIGLGTLVDQVAGFSAGQGDGMMQVAGLGLARILICYEGIFPEEIQRGEVRPDILLILTNDAWFGKGAGPRQHLLQAQARAIEQGLPVVRAANTGISAVIDARGRIVDSLALGEAGYLDTAVPAALPPTLYARIGDWPLLILLGFCIAAGALRRRLIVVDPKGAQG